jgi:hypothetical protein
MRKILNFFIFLAAVAVILMTINFLYLYAQNKEAESIVFRLTQTFLNKINSL